jgi:hypothetical protein
MKIPSFFIIPSSLFRLIRLLTENEDDNEKLGKAVRIIIEEYKEGKYNPPPSIDLDEKP